MIECYRLIPNDWYISCKYLNTKHGKMIIRDLMIEDYRFFPNKMYRYSKCLNIPISKGNQGKQTFKPTLGRISREADVEIY